MWKMHAPRGGGVTVAFLLTCSNAKRSLQSFSLTLGNLKSVIDCYYSGFWVFFPMGVGGSRCQLWGYSTQQLPLRHTLSWISSLCVPVSMGWEQGELSCDGKFHFAKFGTGRIELWREILFCQVPSLLKFKLLDYWTDSNLTFLQTCLLLTP